jgi:hypothetical protein
MAAYCAKCDTTVEADDMDSPLHKRGCPRQTEHERIAELEEALRLARYEIDRVIG